MTSADSTDPGRTETVWEVRLPAGATLLEIAADLLWSAGATAVEERSTSSGMIAVASTPSEAAARSIAGTLAELAGDRLDGIGPVEVERCEVAMRELWRDHARWRRLTPRIAVGPDWIEPPTCDQRVAIEPAGSFGLGDHPTTALVAGELLRLIRPGDRVVDLGTGSGTLAILAAISGAVRVVGIDIAPAAVEAARSNAVRAEVSHLIDVVLDGTGEHARNAFPEGADLVVANILAPEIAALAPAIESAAARDGRVILSGFPERRISSVLAAFPDWTESRRCLCGAWAAVTIRRR